jgi:hypothetical protein
MRPASATARVWLCTLLAALCAGCGGGEAPEPKPPEPNLRVIEFYGDSLTFGSIAGPSGELTRLAVPPVRRAQELLGASALCVDLSLPGATVRDALDGVNMMPFGRFADHVAATSAQTLVIRYGGADALRGTPLPDFERDLSALVRLAQSAGKTVLMVGVIATTTGVTDDFDLAVERTADAMGLGFVDVRAVPFAFPDDLADGVHPAQAWSDRLTAAIVRHLNSPQP